MKKVIVLGAGTVGCTVADHFLNRDCSVVLCDDDAGRLKEAEAKLSKVSGLLVPDLRDGDEVVAVIEKAAGLMGGLDGFVNALDSYEYFTYEEMDYAQWRGLRERCLDVPFIWGQRIGAKLTELGQGGFILYVISDLCTRQDPDQAPRCAVSWGMKGLIRSMAVTLGKAGITVNGVAVGPLDTPEDAERSSRMAAALGKTPDQIKAAQTDSMLTGRLVTADEVAQLCDFLTWEAINVSGQAVLLNGGTCFN